MHEKMALALRENSLDVMQTIPKSDLHSHGSRGGHVSYVAEWANAKIELPPKKFLPKENKSTLFSMQEWFKKVIKPHCIGFQGHLKLWEAALFKQ